MASPRVYLDHNATAPLRPQARTAALAVLAFAANPSSVHAGGPRARALVEDARRQVACLAGSRPERVVFTSGATEAAHLALSPDMVADGRRGFDRLLVGATEHAAVLHGHRFGGEAVETVPVLPTGVIDLAVACRLRSPAAVAASWRSRLPITRRAFSSRWTTSRNWRGNTAAS